MVVDQLDIVGIAVAPVEAEAPLVIDADALLAGAVAAQLLESVPGLDPEIVRRHGGVQDSQLSEATR